MPLVDPRGDVSREKLQEIYRGHRGAIVGLKASLETGSAAPVDQGRWRSALDLSTDMLRLFPGDVEAIPPDRLADYVNASYDVMVVLVDLLKTAFGIPLVPKARE